jgi:hypothetical protein
MTGSLADLQFAALVALVAFVVLVVFVRHAPRSGSLRKEYCSHHANSRSVQNFNSFDVGHQLQAVMNAPFRTRRVMNSGEYHVFRLVEDVTFSLRRGHRVFAQTSLGAVLESPNENAFRSINSKRVDALVVDKGGRPVLAVEYQGAGHYQGTAPARDAIKKEALRKAGVGYLEVLHTDDFSLVRLRIKELLESTSPNPHDEPIRGAASPTLAIG